MLPEDLQALPYIPVIVSATPWFVILAVLALILSVISRRWIAMLMALACIGLQVWWQWPFFSASTKLPAAVDAAMASTRADTGDMIARVMTFNVYKGHADAKAIVDIVRDQRVEVLALQETTNDFVKKLDEAGIHSYLPYSQVSSSDGVYGNGIWSATELGRPVDDEVGSSASFMPGGTVTFGGGKAQLRFVSVHTTAPIPGYWSRWKRSLDELASMRSREGSRYVFMGDFNATTDHTPFRNIRAAVGAWVHVHLAVQQAADAAVRRHRPYRAGQGHHRRSDAGQVGRRIGSRRAARHYRRAVTAVTAG